MTILWGMIGMECCNIQSVLICRKVTVTNINLLFIFTFFNNNKELFSFYFYENQTINLIRVYITWILVVKFTNSIWPLGEVKMLVM